MCTTYWTFSPPLLSQTLPDPPCCLPSLFTVSFLKITHWAQFLLSMYSWVRSSTGADQPIRSNTRLKQWLSLPHSHLPMSPQWWLGLVNHSGILTGLILYRSWKGTTATMSSWVQWCCYVQSSLTSGFASFSIPLFRRSGYETDDPFVAEHSVNTYALVRFHPMHKGIYLM